MNIVVIDDEKIIANAFFKLISTNFKDESVNVFYKPNDVLKFASSNRIDILVLGDNYLINSNYKTYDKYLLDKYYNLNDLNKLFTSENITYKDIIKNIKDNYYVYSKDKKVYFHLD